MLAQYMVVCDMRIYFQRVWVHDWLSASPTPLANIFIIRYNILIMILQRGGSKCQNKYQ